MSYTLEKTQAGTDIVISGWEKGISNNPYEGISDMRNIDNTTIPGEASVALATQAMQTQLPISSTIFTVDPTTDIFTYNSTIPLEINTAIIVTNSGGSLPTGMSINTAYYITSIPTASTFTVSSISAGGGTLNITGAGSGTNTFSTIQMGTPKYFADGILTSSFIRFYFLLDSNGRCWLYNSTALGGDSKWVYMHNQSTEQTAFLGTANGFVFYRDYIFWFSSNSLSALSCIDFSSGVYSLAHFTTRSSWFNNWQTTLSSAPTSSISHYAISAQDDAIYFCNHRSIGSLSQAIGQIFNLATSHTVADGVTTNASATISTVSAFFVNTDLGAVLIGAGIPTGSYITTIIDSKHATISANATATGSGITFTITSGYSYNPSALDLPSSDSSTCLAELGTNLLIGGINNEIYPWDRVSPSFSYPIFLSEEFITRMVTVNTTTYVFCGFKGRIYQTNGSNADLFWEIPQFLSNTTNPYILWADANYSRNQLYFGFQVQDNSGSTINQYGGLWSIDMASKGGKLQNQMSYGSYSGYVSSIGNYHGLTGYSTPANDGYGMFIGWNNGVIGGVDKGISSPYTSTQGYIISDMVPVGQYLSPKTFRNIEFKIASPLVSGESITFGGRKNINDSFTPVPILQGGGIGDISGIGDITFENNQWLQIKVTLVSTNTAPSFVRLREIRIR